MAKRNGAKRQTVVHNSLPRKQKIEQHEPY